MGVFTQVASNIEGFARKFVCKSAFASCVNGAQGLLRWNVYARCACCVGQRALLLYSRDRTRRKRNAGVFQQALEFTGDGLVKRASGPIHTGREPANLRANPLILLPSSVNTPIHNSRFHWLVCASARPAWIGSWKKEETPSETKVCCYARFRFEVDFKDAENHNGSETLFFLCLCFRTVQFQPKRLEMETSPMVELAMSGSGPHCPNSWFVAAHEKKLKTPRRSLPLGGWGAGGGVSTFIHNADTAKTHTPRTDV